MVVYIYKTVLTIYGSTNQHVIHNLNLFSSIRSLEVLLPHTSYLMLEESSVMLTYKWSQIYNIRKRTHREMHASNELQRL